MKQIGATLVLFILVSSAAFAKPPTASFNPVMSVPCSSRGSIGRPLWYVHRYRLNEGTSDGSDDHHGSQETRCNH
jgi:hypothetical protein